MPIVNVMGGDFIIRGRDVESMHHARYDVVPDDRSCLRLRMYTPETCHGTCVDALCRASRDATREPREDSFDVADHMFTLRLPYVATTYFLTHGSKLDCFISTFTAMLRVDVTDHSTMCITGTPTRIDRLDARVGVGCVLVVKDCNIGHVQLTAASLATVRFQSTLVQNMCMGVSA